MNELPYRSIAVAAAFSPRFQQVVTEARRARDRFGATLSFIYVGAHNAEAEEKFTAAFHSLQLPLDSAVYYEGGDPADAILAVAARERFELLVAGALEKQAVHRQFLGNVARRLVREAACSLMLFTTPELEPKPFRQIVFMAAYTPHAERAFRRTLRLAEAENCEHLYVLRNYTPFDKARALRRAKTPRAGNARTPEEEETALREFVLAAGETKVPIETRLVRGNTGFSASEFVHSVQANLLVVPLENKPGPEAKLPRRIAWITDVIPSNLWIIR